MAITSVVLIWLLSYVLPSLGYIILKETILKNGTIRVLCGHTFLLISALLSFYFISELNIKMIFFQMNAFFYLFLTIFVFSYALAGKRGLLYGLSTIIQEMSILFMTAILLDKIPLILIIFMIVPFFVYAHNLENRNLLKRIIFTMIWGILTICLFYLFNNIWLNLFLHFLFGLILIKKKIILLN